MANNGQPKNAGDQIILLLLGIFSGSAVVAILSGLPIEIQALAMLVAIAAVGWWLNMKGLRDYVAAALGMIIAILVGVVLLFLGIIPNSHPIPSPLPSPTIVVHLTVPTPLPSPSVTAPPSSTPAPSTTSPPIQATVTATPPPSVGTIQFQRLTPADCSSSESDISAIVILQDGELQISGNAKTKNPKSDDPKVGFKEYDLYAKSSDTATFSILVQDSSEYVDSDILANWNWRNQLKGVQEVDLRLRVFFINGQTSNGDGCKVRFKLPL